MPFHSLPTEILTLVFLLLEQCELDHLLGVFPDQKNELFQIVRAVKYSRIIVTNTWHTLLKLLIRAKQIIPMGQIPMYIIMSFEDFFREVGSLDQKLCSHVKTEKRIVYAFGSDGRAYNPEIHKLMRSFSRFLQDVPNLVKHISKEISIFISNDDALAGDLGNAVNRLFFKRIFLSHGQLPYLETLRIENRMNFAFDESGGKVAFHDFTRFLALKKLVLSNLEISSTDLSGPRTWFPPTLVELRLPFNIIDSLEKIVFPEGLRVLDLSYNFITCIDGEALPNGLEILYLRNNKITRIEALPDSLLDLNISLNEISDLAFDVPAHLKVLSTDWSQYYLMPRRFRDSIIKQKVFIKL